MSISLSSRGSTEPNVCFFLPRRSNIYRDAVNNSVNNKLDFANRFVKEFATLRAASNSISKDS